MVSIDISPRYVAQFRSHYEVDPVSGCWEWHGRKKRGYGEMQVKHRIVRANRFSYALAHGGVIPDGLLVDHICHNPGCVNPRHLRLSTPEQNGAYRIGCSKNSKSGVRGVFWRSERQAWQVGVLSGGRHYKKGPFKKLEDAKRAAHDLRRKLFGDRAGGD